LFSSFYADISAKDGLRSSSGSLRTFSIIWLGSDETRHHPLNFTATGMMAQTSSFGWLLPSRLPKLDIEKVLNRTMFALAVLPFNILSA